MLPGFIDREKIPHKPGVYQYKNKSGRVIYVGKAIDLYHRVASYFNKSDQTLKTATLVENIASIETIIVESELEALILEANLIKKYLPQFNVSLKDDKDYLYIVVTKEDLPAGRQGFPRVITARKQELKNTLKYFGPFPSSRTVRETLKSLRRVFPWCAYPSWRLEKINSLQAPGRRLARPRPCFYYHLGQCPGPCVGLVDQKEYRKNINRLIKFLEGNTEKLVKELTKEMEQAAKGENFEEAQRIKKILVGIAYLLQSNRTSSYLENPNFLENQHQIGMEELQKVLNLPTFPVRIECYDISNIQGHESTGSMVVLTNGEIDKSQYRKFKIKMTGKPNDVGMHQEMMSRRLNHPEWGIPDLMIIDGGLGQVHAVEPIIHNSYPLIPVYGLAKRFEWLYGPDGNIVKLPKRSEALKMVIKIRDEAHRFAITYHRKLHRKNVLG